MDGGEDSAPNPGIKDAGDNNSNTASILNHDAANFLGSFGLHYGAFPFLGGMFGAALPFGGLGLVGDSSSLSSSTASSHLPSPGVGGADWWRSASEHARLLASAGYHSSIATDAFGGGFPSAIAPGYFGVLGASESGDTGDNPTPTNKQSSHPLSSSPGKASCSSGKSSRSVKDGHSPTPVTSSPMSKNLLKSSNEDSARKLSRDSESARKKSTDGESDVNPFSHAVFDKHEKRRSLSSSTKSTKNEGDATRKSFSESPVIPGLSSANSIDMLSKDDLPTYLSSAASAFPFPFQMFPSAIPSYPGLPPFPFPTSVGDSASLFSNPLLSSAFSSIFPPPTFLDGYSTFGMSSSLSDQAKEDSANSSSNGGKRKKRVTENGSRERSMERTGGDVKRETSLDSVRSSVSLGLGSSQEIIKSGRKPSNLDEHRQEKESVRTDKIKESHGDKFSKVESDESSIVTSVIRSNSHRRSPPSSEGLNWQEAYKNLCRGTENALSSLSAWSGLKESKGKTNGNDVDKHSKNHHSSTTQSSSDNDGGVMDLSMKPSSSAASNEEEVPTKAKLHTPSDSGRTHDKKSDMSFKKSASSSHSGHTPRPAHDHSGSSRLSDSVRAHPRPAHEHSPIVASHPKSSTSRDSHTNKGSPGHRGKSPADHAEGSASSSSKRLSQDDSHLSLGLSGLPDAQAMADLQEELLRQQSEWQNRQAEMLASLTDMPLGLAAMIQPQLIQSLFYPPEVGPLSSSSNSLKRGRGRGGRRPGRGRRNLSLTLPSSSVHSLASMVRSHRGRGRGRGRGLSLQAMIEEHQRKADALTAQIEAELGRKRSGRGRTISSSSSRLADLAGTSSGSRHAQRNDSLADGRDSDSEVGVLSRLDSGTDTDDVGSHVTRDSVCSTPTGSRRRSGSEGGDDGVPKKRRRRTIFDETSLKVPLSCGWQRETHIREMNDKGIVGEVTYTAPCGKRLKSYIELDKYIQRANIANLTRENFTFSTSVNVGDFFEMRKLDSGKETLGKLTVEEVAERFVGIEARKKRILERRNREDQKAKEHADAMNHKLEAIRRRKQMEQEQQELARKVAEMRMRKKLEEQQQREMMKRARQMKVIEMKRMKEHQKLLVQQEKLRAQEQQRQERELRAQQLLEEKEMRRRQAEFLRDQERERRRQQYLLAKAMEARRRFEDREKSKADKKSEKKLQKEKKLEQKRLEMQLAREMNKPVEDMRLKVQKKLPEMTRLPGITVPTSVFGNCLMLMEFLQTYGPALGLDRDMLPSLAVIQGGLLNEPEFVDDFLNVITRLVKIALNDPGISNAKEAVTLSGYKLSDLYISEGTVSEAMRLFIKGRNGKDNEISEMLREKPFQCLPATVKCDIVTFIANELLCSRLVMREMDKIAERTSSLRRDRCAVEVKLRKLRGLLAKKFLKPQTQTPSTGMQNDEGSNVTGTGRGAGNGAGGTEAKDGSDDEEEGESGNESDATESRNNDSDEEDASLSKEDLEKKIDAVTKQHVQCKNKVLDMCFKTRGVSLGMDRYRRRYWAAPSCGGVYVEGAESADAEEFLALLSASKEADRLLKEAAREEVLKSFLGEDKTDIIKVKEEERLNKVDVESKHDIPTLTNSSMEVSCEDDCKDRMPVLDGEMGLFAAIDMQVQELLKPKVDDDSPSGNVIIKAEQTKMVNGETDDVETDSEKKDSVKMEIDNDEQSSSQINSHRKTNYLSTNDNESSMDCSDEKLPTSDLACSTPLSTSEYKVPNNSESKTSFETPYTSSIRNLENVFNHCVNSDFAMTPDGSSVNMSSAALSFMSNGASPAKNGASSLVTAVSNSPSTSVLTVPSIAMPGSSFLPRGGVVPTGRWFSIAHRATCLASGACRGGLAAIVPANCDPVEEQQEGSGSLASLIPKDEEDENVWKDPKPLPLGSMCGWWRISDPEQLKQVAECLHERGIREHAMARNLVKYLDYASQTCKRVYKDSLILPETSRSIEVAENWDAGIPLVIERNVWDISVKKSFDVSLMEEVENLEYRVYHSSLQVKNWLLPVSVLADIVNKEDIPDILDKARSRLLGLERHIERRYLKPPLSKGLSIVAAMSSASMTTRDTSGDEDGDDGEDSNDSNSQPIAQERIPRELLHWRQAVSSATSASQIWVCLQQLESSIAWEKSVMRVICQICVRDDNEAQLLLCDSCDKGYHTYCFRPQLEGIPDGNWYCFECIAKATGEPCCIVCGTQGSKLAECDTCPRAIHIECMDPPVTRIPRKWTCAACAHEKGLQGNKMNVGLSCNKNSKSSKKKSQANDTAAPRSPVPSTLDEATGDSQSTTASTPQQPEKKSKKTSKEHTKEHTISDSASSTPSKSKAVPAPPIYKGQDFSICGNLLSELEANEDGWPFLSPVDTKKFPAYKKIIKQPMDFTTIRQKLQDHSYTAFEEFASDVRLVFDNCRTFNEDNSAVGQAGHHLRTVFERRWRELTGSELMSL